MNHLRLDTNMEAVNQAFRIALGDLYGNISYFQDGLLSKPRPVILAGLEYDTPWTRDASINVWNGASLLFPEESRDTLLCVLVQENGIKRIGGQYWDAIIWAAGAWQYYVTTKDRGFLSLASEALENSLLWFEEREYNPDRQLFSGAACYGGRNLRLRRRVCQRKSGRIRHRPLAFGKSRQMQGKKTAEWVCPYILCPPTVCTSWPTSGLWIWPGTGERRKI